jgi:hypothetical protein
MALARCAARIRTVEAKLIPKLQIINVLRNYEPLALPWMRAAARRSEAVL